MASKTATPRTRGALSFVSWLRTLGPHGTMSVATGLGLSRGSLDQWRRGLTAPSELNRECLWIMSAGKVPREASAWRTEAEQLVAEIALEAAREWAKEHGQRQ